LEKRLKLLFALQQIDSGLDELQELKGDLPRIVANLESQLQAKKALREELENTVKLSIVKRDETDTEILTLKEKIEKYKTQQFQIKTNKQYDALAREIDHSQDTITKLAKEMEALEARASLAKEDAVKLLPEIEALENELAEKRAELEEVNKEHEDEELKLQHEREKITVKIQKNDLQLYERIRKAKGGKAVVPVKRNACGGCYNRVPPQTVLELRKNSRIITCERCGRVLVSDEIVESYSNGS
jgi:hypothetical protein